MLTYINVLKEKEATTKTSKFLVSVHGEIAISPTAIVKVEQAGEATLCASQLNTRKNQRAREQLEVVCRAQLLRQSKVEMGLEEAWRMSHTGSRLTN